MSPFDLFDSVKLKEPLPLSEGGTLPVGTPGAIVEVFDQGEAYMVEFFGSWVKLDDQGRFIPASQEDEGSFMQTVGVEVAKPEQLSLITPARETVGVRVQILSLLDELSESALDEVRDFAEFLRSRQDRARVEQG